MLICAVQWYLSLDSQGGRFIGCCWLAKSSRACCPWQPTHRIS